MTDRTLYFTKAMAEGLAGAPIAGLGKEWAGGADQRDRADAAHS